MKPTFDIRSAIEAKISHLLDTGAELPSTIGVSPALYQDMVAEEAAKGAIGNLIIGCAPLFEIETAAGKLRIEIDEMLPETVITLH